MRSVSTFTVAKAYPRRNASWFSQPSSSAVAVCQVRTVPSADVTVRPACGADQRPVRLDRVDVNRCPAVAADRLDHQPVAHHDFPRRRHRRTRGTAGPDCQQHGDICEASLHFQSFG